MFGIQTSELIVIALVAVLVFGPERVPEFFHKAGKIIGSLQRTADDVWTTLQTELNEAAEPLREVGRDLQEAGERFATGTGPEDEPESPEGEEHDAASPEDPPPDE